MFCHNLKINPPRKSSNYLPRGLRALFTALCLVIIMRTPALSQNLDSLKMYFLEGDYRSAIQEGEKLIAQDAGVSSHDEIYFMLGLSYLKDANYLRASDIFEIILKEFKGSKFKDEARMCLGDSYFLRQDYDKAQEIYQESIKQSPSGKFKPLTFYRLSQVGFKKGDSRAGKFYLDKLKQEFPLNAELISNSDSCSIDSAGKEFFYTVQVGSFASIVNARNLTEKLIQKGYPAFNQELALNNKTSYRVRVGKYSTRKEAEDLKDRLSRDGYPTKICP